MTEGLEFAIRAAAMGVGATATSDLWGQALWRATGAPPPNWGLGGRWIGHFPRGRFVHDSIAKAAPVAGERVIGWAAHYAIGLIFAATLLAIAGPGWAQRPTPLAPVLFGLATVAAPFLTMQPGMGMGIAASRTPSPGKARLRSLANHLVFGLGLYGAALLAAAVLPAGGGPAA